MQNLPSACISRTSGSSSLAPSLISGSVLHSFHMSSSASTSTPSCTSPKTDSCFSATVTSSSRSASVMVPHASNIVFTTDVSALSESFVARMSSSVSYLSFLTCARGRSEACEATDGWLRKCGR